MMFSYSEGSKNKLLTCHKDLQILFAEVIKEFDCTIIYGHRGEFDQNKAFEAGNSKLRYPKSKHNRLPSLAVDVLPYPIDWKNIARICYFAGFAMGVADRLLREGKISHKIKWGGDWDGNHDPKNEKFFDGAHFELIEK